MQGLTDAVQLAAKNAGVTLTQVAIDDSEFPFLVFVACPKGDYPKFKAELQKLPQYDYLGGVGDNSATMAFNMIPSRAWPEASIRQIHHRMNLRDLMLYDKATSR